MRKGDVPMEQRSERKRDTLEDAIRLEKPWANKGNFSVLEAEEKARHGFLSRFSRRNKVLLDFCPIRPIQISDL